MGQGYQNTSGTRTWSNFSSPLGMSRVTDKYMRIGSHPAPLPCLLESTLKHFDYDSSQPIQKLPKIHFILQD